MKGIVFDKNLQSVSEFKKIQDLIHLTSSFYFPQLPKDYDQLFKRISKTCYYGPNRNYAQNTISKPLAEFAADRFSDTHKGYSLNRLNHITAGQIESNVCSLILATIYLDRLKDTDPEYVRKITPTELFIVSMVNIDLNYIYDFLNNNLNLIYSDGIYKNVLGL